MDKTNVKQEVEVFARFLQMLDTNHLGALNSLFDAIETGQVDPDGWAQATMNCNNLYDVPEIATEFFAADILEMLEGV